MSTTSNLKEYRILRSLTQEDLAKTSGVSIRTIQRIEKGLSFGSPYTNKALAHSLDIRNEDLFSFHEVTETSESNGLSLIRLMNLSILSVLVLPFGNILLPTILYYINRQDQEIKDQGRKILSFQILSTVILAFFTIILFIVIGRGNGAIPRPVAICYLMYITLSTITVLMTANDINKDQEVLRFVPSLI